MLILGVLSTVAAAIALALVARARSGPRAAVPAWCAALASITATALRTGPATVVPEMVLLLILIALVTVKVPARRSVPAAALLVAATAAMVLRSPAAGWSLMTVAGCLVWGIAGLAAAAAGAWLRWSRAATERAERLRLAADLHDYVAHDVSEMLALAQAGQIAPSRSADMLRSIEEAARRAMESLDRTVTMLDDTRTESVDDLAERFRRSGGTEVAVDLDPGLRHQPAAMIRVVAEALTNVRRHAPAATLVRIEARRAGRSIELCVTDDGGPVPAAVPARDGGRGLPGLSARLAEAGGTLDAGPRPGGGWQVTARIPRRAGT